MPERPSLAYFAPTLRDARAPDGTGGMAQVAGGTCRMGSDANYREERPAHSIAVDGFWTDRHVVTNCRLR
jgi:sulfatase modifying factor 1